MSSQTAKMKKGNPSTGSLFGLKIFSVDIKPKTSILHVTIKVRFGYAIMNQFGVTVTRLVAVAGTKYPLSTIFMSIV